MATENNGVTEQPVDAVANPAAEETTVAADLKGKGKAVATAESHGDVAMDEDDDDEEEDEEVGLNTSLRNVMLLSPRSRSTDMLRFQAAEDGMFVTARFPRESLRRDLVISLTFNLHSRRGG